jgi:hypothetical protein
MAETPLPLLTLKAPEAELKDQKGKVIGSHPPAQKKLGSLTMHIFWSNVLLKKTLVSPQNLENKRPEIFPPPRSMVLKVVTGTILETLKLSLCLAACGCVLGTEENGGRAKDFAFAVNGRLRSWDRPTVGLSKIRCFKDRIIF